MFTLPTLLIVLTIEALHIFILFTLVIAHYKDGKKKRKQKQKGEVYHAKKLGIEDHIKKIDREDELVKKQKNVKLIDNLIFTYLGKVITLVAIFVVI